MRKRSFFKVGAIAAALAALALCLPNLAAAQTPDNEWHFIVGLDLWGPTINGKLKYARPPGSVTPPPEVEVGPNDYLTNLKAAVPVFFEGRKGSFSIFADVLYLSLGKENSRVIGVDLTVPVDVTLNANTTTTLKAFESTLVGGYSVAQGEGGNFDVIGGARYFSFKSTTDWQLTADITSPGGGVILTKTGTISERVNLWAGVVGAKGRVNLSKHWSLPFYADIGTGTPSLTYQLVGGVTYGWSWGSAGLVFRHLYYDMKDDKLVQKMTFSGPALTFAARF